jgi:hypothetical protein
MTCLMDALKTLEFKIEQQNAVIGQADDLPEAAGGSFAIPTAVFQNLLSNSLKFVR